ncbi:MAG: hypothetical protein JW846_09165 [Dehalococcoidia bacterium]|nr:hypothetical protein [Dehalococcoidia bacterium]
MSLAYARKTIEAWSKEYNSARPLSSLGGLNSQEYAETTTGLQLALYQSRGKVSADECGLGSLA